MLGLARGPDTQECRASMGRCCGSAQFTSISVDMHSQQGARFCELMKPDSHSQSMGAPWKGQRAPPGSARPVISLLGDQLLLAPFQGQGMSH